MRERASVHLSYNPTCVPRPSVSERASTPDPARWIRSPRDRVLALIVVTLIGRLILALTIGLGIDESYQVSVSRPLSLSYFEHPPLAFWIPGVIRVLSGSMNGALNAFAIHSPVRGHHVDDVPSHGAPLRRTRGCDRRAHSERVAGAQPEHGELGSPRRTAHVLDARVGVLCLERVLPPASATQNEPRAPTLRWILAGACAGLAMLSKYHGVFLLAGTGLFLLTNAHARRRLRHRGPISRRLSLLWYSPRSTLERAASMGFVSLSGRARRESRTPFGIARPNIGRAARVPPAVDLHPARVGAGPRADRSGATSREGITPRRRRRDAALHASDDARAYAARWWLTCLAIVPIATFELIAAPDQLRLPNPQAPGWLMAIPLLAAHVDSTTPGWLTARAQHARLADRSSGGIRAGSARARDAGTAPRLAGKPVAISPCQR